MPQSFTSLHFHLIFSTKNRMPLIGADLQSRLFEYIGGMLRSRDSRLIAAGGMPDHVHLLVSLSKEMAVADAVRFVKSNSSKWIHETFPNMSTFAWQTGYAAFAVSFSNIDGVKEYIDNQPEHHRQKTFQEEFIAFLKRHGIEYDERYLFHDEAGA